LFDQNLIPTPPWTCTKKLFTVTIKLECLCHW